MTPLRIGFDPYDWLNDRESLIEGTNMMGISCLDLHIGSRQPDESLARKAAEFCLKNGWEFLLNVEMAPIGWDMPAQMLQDAAKSGKCLGVVFDECDHRQINAHWEFDRFLGHHVAGKHYFAETEGMSLRQAYEAVLDNATRRNAVHRSAGLPVISEHLFPAMMHVLARAGFTVSTKVLKETQSVVMLACAVGAAKQYGTDLMIDVDEWWHPQLCGHSMKRYHSALRLAYWMGPSVIYTEGGQLYQKGWHGLELTDQGRHLRDFAAKYVPEHPWPFTFRDLRPTTAIIHFDDTCFDDRQTRLTEFPCALYGHVPADRINTEWLYVWNLLTHGYVRTDSLTHTWETKLPCQRILFAPMNNVVVYDHLAGDRELQDVDFIFFTGIEISPRTYAAVSRRVKEGATCVTPARLLPSEAGPLKASEITIIRDGKGKWVVPADFYQLHYECWRNGPAEEQLRDALEGLLGPEDEWRYRFGDQQVIGRMVDNDPDVLEFGLQKSKL
jgi:hypothetical protein